MTPKDLTDQLDEILNSFRQQSIIIDNNNSLGRGEGGRKAFEDSLKSAVAQLAALIYKTVESCVPKQLADTSPVPKGIDEAMDDNMDWKAGWNDSATQTLTNAEKLLRGGQDEYRTK